MPRHGDVGQFAPQAELKGGEEPAQVSSLTGSERVLPSIVAIIMTTTICRGELFSLVLPDGRLPRPRCSVRGWCSPLYVFAGGTPTRQDLTWAMGMSLKN